MFDAKKTKPGVPPKGKTGPASRSMNRPRPSDPNDTSLEHNLKQLLDEEGMKEPGAEVEQQDDPLQDVDAPLVRVVNSILTEALRLNASDIHIEPFETFLRVRFRIDGMLQEVQKMPHKLASPIVSRLKIMAQLDICEKRLPQDGCIKLRTNDAQAEFRLSTLPSVFGEKIVMRVMGTASVNNDLSKLGIPEKQLALIRDAISRPDGLILVTGPTGSGKTTTLYAALNELNDISVSVFTAEDPVEGTLLGVTQCHVNPTVGYTFATILHTFLRQDPDVILVGEIRDQETAEIAIKAALTGHMVLSTLHTNCAVSTIQRLLNMGMPDYLLASSLACIAAQRLVRRVCTDCKFERPPAPELVERLGKGTEGLNLQALAYGRGCPKCNNTGYRGRAPIYEVLSLSDNLRRLILAGASREDLKSQARIDGMTTLRESGLALVRDGITTLEEVLGATNEDGEIKEPLALKTPAQVYMQQVPLAQNVFVGQPQPAGAPTAVAAIEETPAPPAVPAPVAPQPQPAARASGAYEAPAQAGAMAGQAAVAVPGGAGGGRWRRRR